MKNTQSINLFKVLGHPERYAILRRLMATRATLTQLGEAFNKTPAHIRHHLIMLEQAGLVEFVEARSVQGGPEKYYRATQHALFIQQVVLPELLGNKVGITIASMDSGVQYLAGFLAHKQAPFALLPIPISSLDGLIALRQGVCQMSTCHLIDPQTEEYNRPFIRHLFPGQSMALVQIYGREEGLIVKPRNPLEIRTLEDLTRPQVLFVNRESGSGVRQWLELHLRKLGIQPELVRGFDHILHSHAEIARTIREGRADTGVGIAASAREFGLDFIPLYEEPFEIVVPAQLIDDERYAPFFEIVNSGEFRAAVRKLDGYVVSQASGGIEIVR